MAQEKIVIDCEMLLLFAGDKMKIRRKKITPAKEAAKQNDGQTLVPIKFKFVVFFF